MGKKRMVGRLLSAGEIEILHMLWQEGPVTLVEAQRALGTPIGYTTVQTRLNRLVDRGQVSRGRKRPAHYQAAITPDVVSGGDLDLLLERVSGGRVVPLVAHLVKERRLSASEIKELKELIAAAEQRTEGS